MLQLAWGAACAGESPSAQESNEVACAISQGQLKTPGRVSFQGSIVPLWERSCNGSHCHLGPREAESFEAFAADWIGVHGHTTLDMLLIAPYQPEESLVMRKLDGDHVCLDLECSTHRCGQRMPPGEPLDARERALFRRWIADGASIED